MALENLLYDGRAAKVSKAIKAGSSFSGEYTTENYVQEGWGDVFDYTNLDKELKKLLDWFFDADFPADLEYEGLTADEVSKPLAEEHLPQGFDLEKLKNWLVGIKKQLAH